ncbi:rhombosortase, partial [Vibrio breoganii]
MTNTSFQSLAALGAITRHGFNVYPVLIFISLLCVLFQFEPIQA